MKNVAQISEMELENVPDAPGLIGLGYALTSASARESVREAYEEAESVVESPVVGIAGPQYVIRAEGR